jgi:hypothetical protein
MSPEDFPACALPPLAIGNILHFRYRIIFSLAYTPVVPDALFPLFAESIMEKFLVALLTVIALSGAVEVVLVASPNSEPAAW